MRRIACLALGVALGVLLLAGCTRPKDQPKEGQGSSASGPAGTLRICLLPKKKGSPYFTSCAEGAREAAEDLGDVELIYDGPTDGTAKGAADLVEKWAARKVDVICVSASDPTVLARAMARAKAKGVKLITWDADTPPDSREFFVNQATEEQIGQALVEALAADIGGQKPTGQVAVISANTSASNQNAWMKYMKAHLATEKFRGLELVKTVFPGEDQKKAQQQAKDLMNAYPKLKGIWGISSVSFPAAAEAVKQEGKAGQVQVTGLSTPNVMREYVKSGVVKSVVLWNTKDLGYLTIRVAEAVARGKIKKGDATFDAGRLGTKKIQGDNVLLGKILIFNKGNIDDYDF